MFDSRDDALSFRDDIVNQLVKFETTGFHVKPTLDGVTIKLGGSPAPIRGRLDGQGYRVTDVTPDDPTGWDSVLEVRPS